MLVPPLLLEPHHDHPRMLHRHMSELDQWHRTIAEMALRREAKIKADAPARLVQLRALGSMARDQVHTLVLGMRQRVISCTLETPGKERDAAFAMILAEMEAELNSEIITLAMDRGLPEVESIESLGRGPHRPDD